MDISSTGLYALGASIAIHAFKDHIVDFIGWIFSRKHDSNGNGKSGSQPIAYWESKFERIESKLDAVISSTISNGVRIDTFVSSRNKDWDALNRTLDRMERFLEMIKNNKE